MACMLLVFHGSIVVRITMCVDDLPHGLYTCCAYILGNLVDVDVIETNCQPADKRIDL